MIYTPPYPDYTPDELAKLRAVVETKLMYGCYRRENVRGWSRPYNQADLHRMIEAQVRTHMLAGHTAEDLIASEVDLEPQ